MNRTLSLSLSLCVLLMSLSLQAHSLSVSDDRLDNAVSEAGNWLAHGKTWREQRYSPLQQINEQSVAQLGIEWFFETPFNSGLEGTPLVVDGVMYASAEWSVVYALDASNGKLLWKFDPQVPRSTSYKYCCGAVNRGVAVWQDKVYLGTLDGRLIAIDAASGLSVWQAQTTDPEKAYSITGAPRIANGKVIIGNGGSEYGVRGYVSAYDAQTGEQVWRFYTIPGNPADGFENELMATAAKTWTGEWWKMGGGGTVWDSIAFDPELNLLYIGVGNGAPHNRNIRSPEGGDNLFLTSIVALNPDTGEYVWHHQQVNGDSWDYTATQQMVLAEIEWQGQLRQVLMQAPKAGFFYIYDRATGELLSAEPYVKVNWASGYDMATGRPIENPEARYPKGSKVQVYPTGLGGHNWHSMSYSPDTGLMYIPTLEFGAEFEEEDDFVFRPRHWNIGYKSGGPPFGQELTQAIMKNFPKAYLMAWDPRRQQEVWRAPYPYMSNGGTLATAGNLVFQGSADGYFYAYRADTGERLWQSDVQNGVMAAPVSYRVGDEQYVTILVGRGGAISMILGISHRGSGINGRMITFKLGANGQLPAMPATKNYPQTPPSLEMSQQDIDRGQALFNRFCSRCHGMNAVSDGSVPDLRHLEPVWHENFQRVVREGMMEEAGMPRFDDVLDEADARRVQAYLIERSHEDRALRESPGWWLAIKQWFYTLVAKIMAWLVN